MLQLKEGGKAPSFFQTTIIDCPNKPPEYSLMACLTTTLAGAPSTPGGAPLRPASSFWHNYPPGPGPATARATLSAQDPHSKIAPFLPRRLGSLSAIYFSSANTSRAAAIVASMSSSVCCSEVKPASYWEGAR